MCLYVESLKFENGRLHHIDLHNKRINETRFSLFGQADVVDLNQAIQIPDNLNDFIYKCRVVYSKSGIELTEFLPYQARIIKSLQLVENNDIDYFFKKEDRSEFELMAANKTADDILIVKNGYITDTSFSNIVFFDGEKWITPATYLLNGTQRQFLLEQKKIEQKKIRPQDLSFFEYAKPINAMLGLDNLSIIKDIHW